MRRRWGIVLAAAIAALLGAVPAGAVPPPPVRVSGPSPYTGCVTPPAGGVVFPEAEVEPHVAGNPRNPANLIGVWQQDRWSNGGAHGLVAGWSVNGGRSWREVPLPFSQCAPGGLRYERASDPVVSIGPDGTAYAVSLSFTPNEVPPSFTTADAIAAAVSTNGGRSWRRVRVIDRDTNGNTQGFLDKEWVVADPRRPGVAYAVWDHWTPLANGDFHVPARFSRTTDYGRTWSRPREIAGLPDDQAATIDTPVVDPRTGTLFTFFVWSVPNEPDRLAFVKSTNGGRTWTAPRAIVRQDAVAVVDPITGDYLRTGDGLFSAAVNPWSGRLYLAWQSARYTGGRYDEAVLTTSADLGRTWSTPRTVSTRYGGPAFLPTIAVNAIGLVGLLYYDFRHDDPATTPLTTDVWFRSVAPDGRRVSADRHLAGPFNYNAAPDAFGRFLGDYQGMTAGLLSFHPFFVTTNCLTSCPANRTDVYTRTVLPALPLLRTSAPGPVTVAPPSASRPRTALLIRHTR